MSYNIDDFKVKKLENFKIALKDFDKKIFGNPEFNFETNETHTHTHTHTHTSFKQL